MSLNPATDAATDLVWRVLRSAADETQAVSTSGTASRFGLGADGQLQAADTPGADALVAWVPGTGWSPAVPKNHPYHALLDLYLPFCGATPRDPVTVGHLGQSLDGFIATHGGDSRFVTGEENIRHLHRMRALSEAVIVGAGTVAADDPQLTTRLVSGSSPLRVVLDPERRLTNDRRVFRDLLAETLYVCGRSHCQPGEAHFGEADIIALDDASGHVDVRQLIDLLHARGCTRIFVEGGGHTVSAFLEAGMLDRLQVAIAALIIGDGKPAIRLPAPTTLSDCVRPDYRVFRMGRDVLFECLLRSNGHSHGPEEDASGISRIL